MLKVGDKVVVKKTDDLYENIVGLEGIIIGTLKDTTTEYLVDFGQGFNGHNGLKGECTTNTAWYMMACSIKKVK